MTEVVTKRSEASAGSESGIRVITGREENEMNLERRPLAQSREGYKSAWM